MNKVEIQNADVMQWAREYDGPKFHSLLADPPYHLSDPRSMRRASPDAGEREKIVGFMQMKWDGGDIAFNPETWAALSEHLYPGAFGFAFASSRGWHRLAVAIEDAGLIIHPTIFCWAQGASFPKATRVPDERFDGHRYGLQSLKNAIEPIICFQKPYIGKPVDCITATGAGALNIDGARIGTDGARNNGRKTDSDIYGKLGAFSKVDYGMGRWPSNFVVDPESARRLDEQSGISSSPIGLSFRHASENIAMSGRNTERELSPNGFGDSGGASRFFFNFDWNAEVEERLFEADPVCYCAKAARVERNAGCEATEPREWIDGACVANRDIRPNRPNGNPHPTVKPIALAKWLATLLLPPIEYAPRRLLVPFAGVGSECVGAVKAGWEHVTGIEQSAEYAAIARHRIRHHGGMFVEVTP